ncbi:MAG: hypothetical protein QY326_08185 [Bdellovibrionota bacterium]|nr:MAG: hypothetical protein QY326_08185 [Bdellovibrionota bacterium]
MRSLEAPPTLGELSTSGIHRDFSLRFGHWHWNLQPKTLTRIPYPEKIRFFFTEAQRELLAGCPCPAKIGPSPQGSFPFVGYVYPANSAQAEQASAWAARFPLAELCTRGHFKGSSWIPGIPLRRLTPG